MSLWWLLMVLLDWYPVTCQAHEIHLKIGYLQISSSIKFVSRMSGRSHIIHEKGALVSGSMGAFNKTLMFTTFINLWGICPDNAENLQVSFNLHKFVRDLPWKCWKFASYCQISFVYPSASEATKDTWSCKATKNDIFIYKTKQCTAKPCSVLREIVLTPHGSHSSWPPCLHHSQTILNN